MVEPRKPLKALVVEDEEGFARIIKMVIQVMGAEIVTAFDGESALNLFMDEEPDIVFCSDKIPGTPPITLLSFFNKMRTMNSEVPVVILCQWVHRIAELVNELVGETVEDDEALDRIEWKIERFQVYYLLKPNLAKAVAILQECFPQQDFKVWQERVSKLFNQKKALIVTYDEDSRNIMWVMLKVMGMEVISANDGNAGLKLFLEEKPDIVFSDYLMPKMDGLMLFKTIRVMNPEIPFVLFTGGGFYWLMKKLEREDVKPDHVFYKSELEEFAEIMDKCFPGQGFKYIQEKQEEVIMSSALSQSNPIKALVVDDEKPIVDLLKKILQKIGGDPIIPAYDGESALMLFLEEKPDIVFCDFAMPGIDGLMLFKAIKAINPKVPFILFTGYYEELLKRLEEENIRPDFILRKPFVGVEKIIEILQECFPEQTFEIK